MAKLPFTILKLLCQNAQTNANNASLLVLVQLPGGSALYMQPEGTIVIAVSINASVGSYSELVDNTEVQQLCHLCREFKSDLLLRLREPWFDSRTRRVTKSLAKKAFK